MAWKKNMGCSSLYWPPNLRKADFSLWPLWPRCISNNQWNQQNQCRGRPLPSCGWWTYRSVINDDVTAGHIAVKNVFLQVLDECPLKDTQHCNFAKNKNFFLCMKILENKPKTNLQLVTETEIKRPSVPQPTNTSQADRFVAGNREGTIHVWLFLPHPWALSVYSAVHTNRWAVQLRPGACA